MTRKQLIKALNKRKSEWTNFAERSGIARRTIQRIAGEDADPRLSTVEALVKALST